MPLFPGYCYSVLILSGIRQIINGKASEVTKTRLSFILKHNKKERERKSTRKGKIKTRVIFTKYLRDSSCIIPISIFNENPRLRW